ncbi:hypothetical protein HAX54_028529 [Datura stramonium]|uniref:Uncharacterized protein n=1 Tax=Datura stramonium TaxID=4076 RepID=A0ABS8V7J6_DATST|nr:hypothetical protein [Datura stramonium]
MPSNIAKLFRKADRHEKQMKLFADQLGTFVDRAIVATLAPYESMFDMFNAARLPPHYEELKAITMVKTETSDVALDQYFS